MKRTVLITGASAGIGKETALLLADNNYTVYATARRADKLRELDARGIYTRAMDVSDAASAQAVVDEMLQREGRIDVLINNAGFGGYGAIEEVPLEDARYQLEVNLLGPARLTQLVLPGMRERGYGKIVNISSIGGKFATPFGGWYHASKFALEAFSDSLRNEVKPFGIDVIVIEPGGVKSEWADIAVSNLLKNTGQSVYRRAAEQFAAFLRQSTSKNSEPSVIAKLILHGLQAQHPRFRYVGGYNARMAVAVRKLLPDRMFDKLVLGQMR